MIVNNQSFSAKKVNKVFGARSVLSDVDIEVGKGEIVGLLGPNGAGKTTLFMIMCGLLTPNSGNICLSSVDVSRKPLYWRAQNGIGYLPQESSIFRNLTVEQNIIAALQRKMPNKRLLREKLESLLSEFHLGQIRKSKGASLSGGERRRTEVARCLAMDPDYILLDEPFAGVDPIAVEDVRMLIQGLAKRGIGVLITDHNVKSTLASVDRAYILNAGRVLAGGTPSHLLENNLVRQVYLGENFSIL